MSLRIGKSKQEKLRRRYREDRGVRLRGMESAKFSFSARKPYKDTTDTQASEQHTEILDITNDSIEPIDSGIDGVSRYDARDAAGKLVARIWIESQVEDIPPSEVR